MLVYLLDKFTIRNILIIFIFFVSLFFFWPGVYGGFIFDDFHNIVNNDNIKIRELTVENLQKAAQGYSGGTRQLSMISFALNFYWTGLNPWAYKVTGLLVHALNSVLVFLLTQHLAKITFNISEHQRRFAALAAAVVWALHPIQVSSALYVVQRMETLCYTFLLTSLLLYLHARRQQIDFGKSNPWLWVGVIVSAFLAALFKESAILLPLFTLSLEIAVLHFATRQPKQKNMWLWFYGTSAIFAALLFIFWFIPQYYRSTSYPGRDFNSIERLLTQARVLWLYVQQIILPLPKTLYFYYDDLPISRSWIQPVTTILAIIAWVVVFSFAMRWRKRFPLIALGVLWFFSAHFITSNIVGLEMVFEHRNYFALLAIILIAFNFIYHIPVRDGPAIKYIGIACIVVGLGALGTIRAATWGNNLLLATDIASKNPKSARAAMDLGGFYYEISGGDSDSPFYQFAVNQFERASNLQNSSAQPDVNLILMHAGGGLPDDFLDIDKVWQRYIAKLATLHLGVETRTSFWSLLEQRRKGKDIDDIQLQKAIDIILKREKIKSYQYALMADYYLNELSNKEKAEYYYDKSVENAKIEGHQELINRVVDDLYLNGHPDIAIKYINFYSKK